MCNKHVDTDEHTYHIHRSQVRGFRNRSPAEHHEFNRATFIIGDRDQRSLACRKTTLECFSGQGIQRSPACRTPCKKLGSATSNIESNESVARTPACSFTNFNKAQEEETPRVECECSFSGGSKDKLVYDNTIASTIQRERLGFDRGLPFARAPKHTNSFSDCLNAPLPPT